jgi:hypothetical protein
MILADCLFGQQELVANDGEKFLSVDTSRHVDSVDQWCAWCGVYANSCSRTLEDEGRTHQKYPKSVAGTEGTLKSPRRGLL